MEGVATSLKYAFSSLREHLQFNFNSHVFIDQMVCDMSHAWPILSLNVVRFVLNVVRFVLNCCCCVVVLRPR